jgi:serine/threonine protein kinase
MSQATQYFLTTNQGPFQILEVLGQGSYGAVYKVLKDNQVYALKYSLLGGSSLKFEYELYQRLKKEINSPQVKGIPAIYQILEVDNSEGGTTIGLLMEYIEGPNLKAWRQQVPPKKIKETLLLQWGMKISNILDRVHRVGFLHRDVKPENIILQQGTNRIYLVDIGLSCFFRRKPSSPKEDSLFCRGSVGTPIYMSADAIDRINIPDNDYYSLGQTLFYLLEHDYKDKYMTLRSMYDGYQNYLYFGYSQLFQNTINFLLTFGQGKSNFLKTTRVSPLLSRENSQFLLDFISNFPPLFNLQETVATLPATYCTSVLKVVLQELRRLKSLA